MATMTKIVNIRTRVAVRNVNPPISGSAKGIVMTTGDILKCLCKRAQVEEVLPDGTTVKLNMRNYYTDNGAGLDAKKNLPAVEKKPVENPARFTVPVAPAEKAEKQVVETKTEEEQPMEEKAPTVEEEPAETETPAEESVEEMFVTGTTVADVVEDTDNEAHAGGIAGYTTTIENGSNSGAVTNNSHNGKKHKHKK